MTLVLIGKCIFWGVVTWLSKNRGHWQCGGCEGKHLFEATKMTWRFRWGEDTKHLENVFSTPVASFQGTFKYQRVSSLPRLKTNMFAPENWRLGKSWDEFVHFFGGGGAKFGFVICYPLSKREIGTGIRLSLVSGLADGCACSNFHKFEAKDAMVGPLTEAKLDLLMWEGWIVSQNLFYRFLKGKEPQGKSRED